MSREYSPLLKVVGLLILLLSVKSMASQDAKLAENEYLLQQAEYFLSSQPAQTMDILNNKLILSTLPVQQKIQWYLLNTKAAVFSNQLDKAQASLKQLFLLNEHALFYEKLSFILSMTGVWLRKSSYLNDAEITFTCALKQPSSLIQQLGIKISLAIIARYQANYPRAKALYKEAYQIAEKLEDERALATIANNLGTLAFDKGQLEQANSYFRKALAGHQLEAKKSGHINAGINLLFVFLLQKEFVNYQRLYDPVAELLENSQDQPKKTYLLWVNSGYQATQGQKISKQLKEKLIKGFNQLEGKGLKRLIQRHLATTLNIEVTIPEQQVSKTFNAPWFEQVKLCNW
jgi:tetratricopeptide (TPR) repeat protein